MRQGQLVYVMGASGSGKDSLLQALRPRLRGSRWPSPGGTSRGPSLLRANAISPFPRNGSRLWRRPGSS